MNIMVLPWCMSKKARLYAGYILVKPLFHSSEKHDPLNMMNFEEYELLYTFSCLKLSYIIV